MKDSKNFSLSKLADILPQRENKEYSVIFLSRPARRFGKVTEESAIICAVNRFEALKIASNRYGRNKIVRIKERKDIRTDMFKTVL